MSAISEPSGGPLWRPSARRIAEANLTRFMGGFRTYGELWQWSVEQPEDFWRSVERFCGVKPFFTRTPEAKLNFTANLLRHADHAPALVAIAANGARRELTHRELYEQVTRAVQAFRAAGLAAGDRLSALLPAGAEAVVAFLAGAAIGAVWAAIPPAAALPDAAAFLAPLSPKLIITDNAVLHKAAGIAQRIPSIAQALVVTSNGARPSLSGLPRALRWQDALAFYAARSIEFEPLLFEHPLAARFDPERRIDGSGEALLQFLKELILHTDLKPADRLLGRSCSASPLWIWQLSALAAGSCVLLAELPPAEADPLAAWRVAELERATILILRAEDLSALRLSGERPRARFGLGALRTVVCDGGPPLTEDVEYVYREVKRDLHFAAMSSAVGSPGHGELGCPILPVSSGRPQVRGLGMPADHAPSFS